MRAAMAEARRPTAALAPSKRSLKVISSALWRVTSMKQTPSRSSVVRVMTATVAIAALAVFAASRFAPRVPLPLIVVYGVLGVLALLAALTVVAIPMLTVMQWALRKGGTDPQWFWFRAEPPGLVELRAEARSRRKRAAAFLRVIRGGR